MVPFQHVMKLIYHTRFFYPPVNETMLNQRSYNQWRSVFVLFGSFLQALHHSWWNYSTPGGLVQYRISVQISFAHNIRFIVQSFWNFAQSTAVILSCSVQNFKTTEQLRNKLLANVISWDLGLRCVSDGYPIMHKAPVRKWFPTTISPIMRMVKYEYLTLIEMQYCTSSR